MATRPAQWAFAAFYLIVAIIAIWGGVNELNPPLPPVTPQNPDPLPLLVNSGMVVASMFYFLTAAGFLAVTFFSARDAMAGKEGALVANLNLAFATFLGIVGVYLLWYGAQLLMLGGSFVYALSGVALLASTYFLIMRKPLGALIYAGIVAFWVLWSILEAGLDLVALLPRLAAWLVVGLWFLSPWHRAAMGKTAETRIDAGGRWVGFAAAAGALLLVVGALQGYPVVEGTKNEVAAGPAVTDWRNYGGVPEGQRFAQLTQYLKNQWQRSH